MIPSVPSTSIITYLTGKSTNGKDQQTTGSLPPGLTPSLVSTAPLCNARNQSTVTLLLPMSVQLMYLPLMMQLQKSHHTVGQLNSPKWQFHKLGGLRTRKTPRATSLASCRTITRRRKVETTRRNFFKRPGEREMFILVHLPHIH